MFIYFSDFSYLLEAFITILFIHARRIHKKHPLLYHSFRIIQPDE